MKLLIRNLARTTTEKELRSLFEAHGTVQSCTLVIDKKTGGSKGFGFVEMPSPGESKAAMKNLNGNDVAGNRIRVKKAQQKPGPGSEDKGEQKAQVKPVSKSEDRSKQKAPLKPVSKSVDRSEQKAPLKPVSNSEGKSEQQLSRSESIWGKGPKTRVDSDPVD